MALRVSIHKKTFHFSFQARTSRGPMRDRICWFVKIEDNSVPGVFGIGESAPLPGLSPEWGDTWEDHLAEVTELFNQASLSLNAVPHTLQALSEFIATQLPFIQASSLIFAFETALLDLKQGGVRKLDNNSFYAGKPIPINGLIWMGGLDYMLQQVEIKIRDGYRCIKLKVGGLDFEKECDILQYIRRKYFREDITIRLDANGALKPDEALYKLSEMAKYTIHSIEQPLKVGSTELEELCRKSPIPVALDEELIGIPSHKKKELIERVKPQYIILKPTLHGGLSSCFEWIKVAEAAQVGWWLTSSLESNVGLNAVAQFTSRFAIEIPQGLGTGTIYSDNIEGPLEISGNGFLSYRSDVEWNLDTIDGIASV